MKQLPIVRLMVILELLKAKDKKSGYQMFKQSPFSHQGLYKELRNLRKSGCVNSYEISQTGKPDKIVYEICDHDKVLNYVKMALSQHVDINSVRPIDLDVVMSFRNYIDGRLILAWLYKFDPQFLPTQDQKWKRDTTLSHAARKAMLRLIQENIMIMEQVTTLRNLVEPQAVPCDEHTEHSCQQSL